MLGEKLLNCFGLMCMVMSKAVFVPLIFHRYRTAKTHKGIEHKYKEEENGLNFHNTKLSRVCLVALYNSG